MCCGEKMIPFGRLYSEELDKTRFVMMIGLSGGFYCYDVYEDAVFQLGDSLSSFAADGLRRLDPIYTLNTVPPVILIDGVISSLAEAENVAAFTAIVAENQGLVYQISDTIGGIDTQMMLYRGNYGTVTSCSLGTAVNMVSIMCSVVRRMSCRFDIIAVVGYKAGAAVFRPRVIILMDAFGAVYSYDNCLNRLCRLADSFKMFLRIGTRKSLLNFRHDRALRGVGRLEKIPYCTHIGNVREIVLDPENEHDVEPQYVRRAPDDSFSVTRMTSFGEPIGHEAFMGRGNKFFDVSRINRNQCIEGFVSDVFSHYDAAYLMRAAYCGYNQVTDLMWSEEIEGLLLGHPTCLPMAFNISVKEALEKLRVLRTAEEEEDSDVESISPSLNDPPCRRCVQRRRIKLFKSGRGYEK